MWPAEELYLALSKTQKSLSKSIGRISTGSKHSGLTDGASEMAYGQKLQSDQVSLKAAYDKHISSEFHYLLLVKML